MVSLQSPEFRFNSASTSWAIGDVSCLLDLHNTFIRDLPIHVLTGVASEELSMLTTSLVKASSCVRKLINDLSPINRLPFEILSRIFALVPAGYAARLTPRGGKPELGHIFGPFAIHISELLLMMRVCCRWRDTLIHCHNLWSVIDDKMFGKKNLYPPYLRRSSTTSVSIYVSGVGSSWTRKFLHESPERVVELRVSDLWITPAGTRKLVTFPAAGLLVCTLTDITLAKKPGTLKLFQGHAPCLRALWLESVYFIPSNSFPSLQHLIIEFPGGSHSSGVAPPKGPYTLTQLLDFLRGCASLKTLYLRDVGSQRVREIPEGVYEESRVSLPQLRRLSVQEGDTRHAKNFQRVIFAHLVLPSNCHIEIRVDYPEDLQPLMDIVARTACRRPSRMQLFANGNVPFRRDPIQLADDKGCQNIEIHLPHRYYAYPNRWVRGNTRRMWSSNLFRGITTLRTAPLPFLFLLYDPHSIYRALSDLEALAISNPQSQVISRLTELIPRVRNNTALPVRFPKLATLCLPEIALDDLPDLYAIVESRERAGHPFKHLAVSLDVTSVGPAADQLYAITQLRDLLADRLIVTWIDKDKSKAGEVPIQSLPAAFKWTYPADCTQDSPWISRPVWQAWPRDP